MTTITLVGTKTDMLRIFQPLIVLNNYVKLLIRDKQIEFKLVDIAHVCMVQIIVDKSYFKKYKISKKISVSDVIEVGIDVEKMVEILSMSAVQPSDETTITLDDENHIGSIEIVSDDLILSAPIPYVNVDNMTEPKIPSLSLPYVFEIKSQKILKQIIRDISKFSDHLRIVHKISQKNKLFIKWFDTFNKEYSYTLTNKLNQTIEYTSKDNEFVSTFPVDYFSMIMKALSKTFYGDTTLQCWIGNDYPIKITAGKKPFTVTYLLAPRIESV